VDILPEGRIASRKKEPFKKDGCSYFFVVVDRVGKLVYNKAIWNHNEE